MILRNLIEFKMGDLSNLTGWSIIILLFYILSEGTSIPAKTQPASIWEPFCEEKVVYKPYVRAYRYNKKVSLYDEPVSLYKEWGPGFVDVSGMRDIFICTNGLVMMYYAKTKGKGDVYEQGELHWSPHHCELYNPVPNNGMPADHPKKRLLAILLIGHPTDYRRPALQMFVAPMFEPKKREYVNITSLVMIGSDGECLIEKGIEKARLRIRNQKPNNSIEIPDSDDAPFFCQLDAYRKLGQRGLITLAKPQETLVQPNIFGNRPYVIEAPAAGESDTPGWQPPPKKPRETGPAITPRFKPSIHRPTTTYPTVPPGLAEAADDVYAGLLQDRKMTFIGCLRYPEFSKKQMDILIKRMAELRQMDLDSDAYATIKTSANFWNNMSVIAWDKVTSSVSRRKKREDPAAGAPPPPVEQLRSAAYLPFLKEGSNDATPLEELTTSYNGFITDLEKAEDELKSAGPDNRTKLEKAKIAAKMKVQVWPMHVAYAEQYKLTKKLEESVRNAWKGACEIAAKNKEKDCIAAKPPSTGGGEVTPPPDPKDATTVKTDEEEGEGGGDGLNTEVGNPDKIANKTLRFMTRLLNTNSAVGLAEIKQKVLVKLASAKYKRRYEPYDAELVASYEASVKNLGEVNAKLRNISNQIGPMISNAETLHARYKVYVETLRKNLRELEVALRHMEDTGQPLPDDIVAKDPFEKYFVDTMIEITDATDADGNVLEAREAKACHPLPSLRGTCKSIKPTSRRAVTLLNQLRRRKGERGVDVGDFEQEDAWRNTVLNHIADIFGKACPYTDPRFPKDIVNIFRGYQIINPLGTGLDDPVRGSRLETVNHKYQEEVYNDTYTNLRSNMTENMTHGAPATAIPDVRKYDGTYGGQLKGHGAAYDPFWTRIIEVLEKCAANTVALNFTKHEGSGNEPGYMTFRHYFKSNRTSVHYKVNDIMMLEKADFEFRFNWALDQMWRMMATAMGICMPQYEKSIPLISARFYAFFSRDFMHPLRQIWMSNRDNPIFEWIVGHSYGPGSGEMWAKICMESSFIASEDRNFRPPRGLYVNAFTEMNYFMSGPLTGTSGMLGLIPYPA